MSTGDGGTPATIPDASGDVHAQVSDVSGGQVAVGGRVFQIDAAQGSYVVINAESDVEVVRRPSPVMRPPPAFSGLVARVAELERIRVALDSGVSVEVHGPAGIGKTALLRAAASYPLPGPTPDGVVAIPARLGTADTLNYVFDTCYVGTRRIVPRREELTTALADLRLTIVLDDTSLGRDDIDALREALPSSMLLLAGVEQRVFDPGVVGIALGGLTIDEGVDLIQAAVGRELTQRERDVGAMVTEVLHGTPLELVRFASLVRRDEGDLVSVARGFGVDAQPEDLLVAVRRSVSVEEEAVLTALAAFDAPVGSSPVAAFTGNTDAGALLLELCERGLVQGDDLHGWRARDVSPALPRDRQRATAVLTAWVRGRTVPEEVSGEIPAIAGVLGQAGRDHRWVDAMALAAAAEGPLALAGRWSAWRDTLESGRSAAVSAGDEASARFFSHELAVMADAETGVMAVTDRPPPVPASPGQTSGQPPHPAPLASTGLDATVPIRWARVIAAAAAALVVIGLGAAAAFQLASAGEETPFQPTAITSPSATDATTPSPTDGGSTAPTNNSRTTAGPHLVAFALDAEEPTLVVGEEKPFTVRVLNDTKAARDVGPSEGGTLMVSMSGGQAELVSGTPRCTPLDSGVLRCEIKPLGVEKGNRFENFTVTLRGLETGSVVMTTVAEATGATEIYKLKPRTFKVRQAPSPTPRPTASVVPSVVPSVVG